MQKIKPLKRFGQNYLSDENILKKIVDEFAPNHGDNIIEIGPGRGALTEKLLNRVESLTAIEIDTRVISDLKQRFKSLIIIEEDFLKVNFSDLKKDSKLRIIGNIPYNLTSPIIFKLINENELIQDSVLMVQLEVARRMIANQGTKDYGILTVLLDYFTETKLCFKISPNVFYPKPKVYSALVHLYFKEISESKEFQKLFIKIVKAAFGNRRKTLKNAFSNSKFSKLNFLPAGVDLTLRAERLTTEDFKTLTNFAYNS